MKTLQLLSSIKDVPNLEKLGVEIEFDPQQEEISPLEMFEDAADVEMVCNDYENGNMAAWFCAHVIVKYKGFAADEYLGCCSYKSFKEFTTADNDYYMIMINQCIQQINKEIEDANFHTQKFWNIRRAKNLIAPYNLYIVSTLELHSI